VKRGERAHDKSRDAERIEAIFASLAAPRAADTRKPVSA